MHSCDGTAGLFSAAMLYRCAEDLNLCSQAVSELHLLAGDTIFNTTSKVQGMYFLATGHLPASWANLRLMRLDVCYRVVTTPYSSQGQFSGEIPAVQCVLNTAWVRDAIYMNSMGFFT